MNGRVYDSETGRFLSADPNIFHPYTPLDFNRYSYVWNNPLRYTDPSGFGLASSEGTGNAEDTGGYGGGYGGNGNESYNEESDHQEVENIRKAETARVDAAAAKAKKTAIKASNKSANLKDPTADSNGTAWQFLGFFSSIFGGVPATNAIKTGLQGISKALGAWGHFFSTVEIFGYKTTYGKVKKGVTTGTTIVTGTLGAKVGVSLVGTVSKGLKKSQVPYAKAAGFVFGGFLGGKAGEITVKSIYERTGIYDCEKCEI